MSLFNNQHRKVLRQLQIFTQKINIAAELEHDNQMKIKNNSTDWHREDILAAVRKKKKSLAALSRENGLSPGTLVNALNKPWPRGERIIANAIGVSPFEIWPSRYPEERR